MTTKSQELQFNDNCQRNGLLTISLAAEVIDELAVRAAAPDNCSLTIDLPEQKIIANDLDVSFDIDPLRKESIRRGLNAVRMTLQDAELIKAFEARYFEQQPWLK